MGVLSKVAGLLAEKSADYSKMVVAPSDFKTIKRRLQKGMYPEEVAKRILSGELDMRPHVVKQRAIDQGYDLQNRALMPTGQLEYHPPKSGKSPYGLLGPSFDPNGTTKWELHDANKIAQLGQPGYSVPKYYDTPFLHNTGRRSEPLYESSWDDDVELLPIRGDYNNPREQVRHSMAAFDPKYVGPNTMGGALAGAVGLGALSQSEDADAGFITKGGKTLLEAWHGSPHKFDKFSMDQIGTGEGAQAYGHGLYFADSEQVARQYRDELSRTVNYDGKPLVRGNRPNSSLTTTGDEAADDHIIAAQGDVDAAIMQLEYDLRNYAPDDPNIPYDQDTLKKLKQIKEDGLITIDDSAGALYRTEIDVTPESLLDWDKPLSEQPNALRAFQEMYSDEAMRLDPEILGPLYSNPADVDMATLGLFDKSKGAQAYNTIKDMNYVRGAPAMSEKLREKGIKGIKYLDGDSRAAGNGTSNYVIFDDSLINITERGNATVPALGVLATGSAAGAGFPAWSEYEGRRLPSFEEGVVAPILGLLSAGEDIGKWAGDKVFEKTRNPALSTIPHILGALFSPI